MRGPAFASRDDVADRTRGWYGHAFAGGCLQDRVVFPGAAYLETMRATCAAVVTTPVGTLLRNVFFLKLLAPRSRVLVYWVTMTLSNALATAGSVAWATSPLVPLGADRLDGCGGLSRCARWST